MSLDHRVSCDCGGLRGAGSYKVDGEWLVLKSTFGVHRVRLGVSKPKKLATKLLKNVCAKAAATTAPPNAVEPVTVAENALKLINVQRNKVAVAIDDP